MSTSGRNRLISPSTVRPPSPELNTSARSARAIISAGTTTPSLRGLARSALNALRRSVRLGKGAGLKRAVELQNLAAPRRCAVRTPNSPPGYLHLLSFLFGSELFQWLADGVPGPPHPSPLARPSRTASVTLAAASRHRGKDVRQPHLGHLSLSFGHMRTYNEHTEDGTRRSCLLDWRVWVTGVARRTKGASRPFEPCGFRDH